MRRRAAGVLAAHTAAGRHLPGCACAEVRARKRLEGVQIKFRAGRVAGRLSFRLCVRPGESGSHEFTEHRVRIRV